MNLRARPNSWDYDLSRPGFKNEYNHHVRSPMESKVCDWLMKRNIAHRHGSEPFVVRMPKNRYNTYVPDIILHDKRDNKRIVIEAFHVDYPRKGRTTLLASFRKYWSHEYFLILVTNSYSGIGIAKGAFDVLADVTHLDALEKELPPPPEEYFSDFLASPRR